MEKTRKMMSTMIKEEDKNMTLEEIAEQYQINYNPSLLAISFEKLYKLILDVSNGYFGLTIEDIVSFSLEKLDYCLQTYDNESALFVTYFTTCLKNKLREETLYLSMQKRKVIHNSESYDMLIEDGFDITYEDEEIKIIDLLEDKNLTEREKIYCRLILKTYTNMEISEMLNVSRSTVHNIKEKLKEKFFFKGCKKRMKIIYNR